MNGAVGISDGAHGVDVSDGHGLRRLREDIGIGQQRLLAGAQLRRGASRRLQARHQRLLIIAADAVFRENGTESRSVMVQSIVALVQGRDADAEQFAFPA